MGKKGEGGGKRTTLGRGGVRDSLEGGDSDCD